ncbi:MAG: DNA-binding protein [Actinomycetota bacterium]|nr:DNA-binding protein [Actinomycetota bacterium]
MIATDERRLYVTWRHPTGSILPIGLLVRRATDHEPSYRFSYLKMAEQQEDFTPLPGLPDLHRSYESDNLFPVFANRQMPRERPDYDVFVQQLGLDREADPFEVLARSEGWRATDRVEVFPEPVRDENGRLTTLFFARGVRHIDGASEAIEGLHVGERLALEPQPTNRYNARALLINTQTGGTAGYLPDYLVDTVHELWQLSVGEVEITAEHINPPRSAPHMRLLCRLAAPWPEGYQPLSGPEFQPLAAG